MQVEIRPAREDDAGAISAMIIRTLRETNARDYDAAIIERVTASFAPAAVTKMVGAYSVFVAIAEDRIVGTGGLEDRSVRSLFVAPDAQGCGIGAALMAEIERHALANGQHVLVAQATITAEGFYAKLGYKALRDAYFGEERTIIMERTLQTGP